MSIKTAVTKYGLVKLLDYAIKNPEENLPKLMDAADKVMGTRLVPQRRLMREAICNKDNPYHDYILRIFRDTDPEVLRSLVTNFFVNVNMVGYAQEQELSKKLDCNIPWAILLDPTSACNLHCTGCWAAEYGNKLNLSFDEIDDIIRQGKELGTHMYIYTGGEPLVRKNDIIKLCEKHQDCVFLCFTNSTLIDEKFADDMLRVKNFVPAISLEGFESATDSRRGDGVYNKVIKAINLLHSKKLVYGISACYTSQNFDSITSEEFYDKLIEMGVYFIWYFHYMPIGNDAHPELLPTPEQRTEIFHRLRSYRAEKPLFAMDFQNDGEFVGGCIAGGRKYLHINANGDIDPCVFIHYADSNIRKDTLLEALQKPLFKAYHHGQPFNKNMLQPCPMLENPGMITEMVNKSGAHSTDLESPESVEHLCAKCEKYAKDWAPVADKLWKERLEEKERTRAAREAEEKAIIENSKKK